MLRFLSLLILAAHCPAQTKAPAVPDSYSMFRSLKHGVAPDERRALLIARGLWEASAGESFLKAFRLVGVRRVGDAWLATASAPVEPNADISDGSVFFAFDAGDGGIFILSEINSPRDSVIVKALKAKRATRAKAN